MRFANRRPTLLHDEDLGHADDPEAMAAMEADQEQDAQYDNEFCVECGERSYGGRRCTYHQNVKDGFG